MSEFVGDLILRDTGVVNGTGRVYFELHESLTYITNSNLSITIPKGFRTDLASIPRFFWRVLPPFGIYDKCVVLHDFCYACGEFKLGDSLLYESMTLLKIPSWKKFSIYLAVRFYSTFFRRWYKPYKKYEFK